MRSPMYSHENIQKSMLYRIRYRQKAGPSLLFSHWIIDKFEHTNAYLKNHSRKLQELILVIETIAMAIIKEGKLIKIL